MLVLVLELLLVLVTLLRVEDILMRIRTAWLLPLSLIDQRGIYCIFIHLLPNLMRIVRCASYRGVLTHVIHLVVVCGPPL